MKTLLFFAFLPAMIALGHDAYLYYEHQDRGFMFADLGFIWTTYHEESYKEAVRMVEPETWSNIDLLLTVEAFYAGLAFGAVIMLLAGIIKLLKMISGGVKSAGGGHKKGKVARRGETTKFEYKRK